MEIGEKINRLTMIEKIGIKEVGNNGKRLSCAIFKCDCGNEKQIIIAKVKNGRTLSCGCLHKRMFNHKKHGLTKHPLFSKWTDIKSRCYNKNVDMYKNYGGRGIKVCDEWLNDFMSFYNWSIENGWEEGLQIDRVNFNGDYEPNNCQFITGAENCAIGKRRVRKDNKYGFVGVYFKKATNKFGAEITSDTRQRHIGYYNTLEEAVEARINTEIELFGEQKTNFHYDKKEV